MLSRSSALGLSLSELNIEKAVYSQKERVYCGNCKTSIFDYHRRCGKCSFNLCLICCHELRNGKLLGGADPVEYLHGVKEKKEEPGMHEWSRSGWHAKSDGHIPCPKVNDECRHSFLELKSILGQIFISDLVYKAEELVKAYKLQDVSETPGNPCSCPKISGNTEVCDNNLRKASSREDSSDNWLYCPRAVDLQREDLKHFQWHWNKGEPVIVSNVLECTPGLSWEPLVMCRAFCRITNPKHAQHVDVTITDCCPWPGSKKSNLSRFFSGYSYGPDYCPTHRCPRIRRLKDWPPNLFEQHLPRHYA
ncbi:hypothetical protein RIF29_23093 [Crotalaria pallida]|uniref:Uncharacterized protein n=1 Tax=Crotalaria pallida TaxID=3830 RepID=A0AAN9F7C2_CROPI